MGRRRKNNAADGIELVVKMIVGGLLLLSLLIGGVTGFAQVFGTLIQLLIWLIVGLAGLALVGGLIYLFVKRRREQSSQPPVGWAGMPNTNPAQTDRSQPPAPEPPTWTVSKIENELGEIDWYQFEKFCAALLRAEGYSVERKGGAQPDGGVDLVATKDAEAMLVQCKHWRTWSVQEKVIRELLGSMTHYQVRRGALYVLKGATRPATAFAGQHGIVICEGRDLASRAQGRLADSELTALLSSREHHCPRCESPMIWRTGNFTPFWGCSTYPRCRGTLKHSGAR